MSIARSGMTTWAQHTDSPNDVFIPFHLLLRVPPRGVINWRLKYSVQVQDWCKILTYKLYISKKPQIGLTLTTNIWVAEKGLKHDAWCSQAPKYGGKWEEKAWKHPVRKCLCGLKGRQEIRGGGGVEWVIKRVTAWGKKTTKERKRRISRCQEGMASLSLDVTE